MLATEQPPCPPRPRPRTSPRPGWASRRSVVATMASLAARIAAANAEVTAAERGCRRCPSRAGAASAARRGSPGRRRARRRRSRSSWRPRRGRPARPARPVARSASSAIASSLRAVHDAAVADAGDPGGGRLAEVVALGRLPWCRRSRSSRRRPTTPPQTRHGRRPVDVDASVGVRWVGALIGPLPRSSALIGEGSPAAGSSGGRGVGGRVDRHGTDRLAAGLAERGARRRRRRRRTGRSQRGSVVSVMSGSSSVRRWPG